MSLFSFEAREDQPRRLSSLFGVDYRVTRRAWLNLPLALAIGVVGSLALASDESLLIWVALAVAFSAAVVAASFVHGVGHIVSSRLVGAPVASVIITATVSLISFNDSADPGPRVHIGRSLGGPIANLALGTLAVGVAGSGGIVVGFFGVVNLAFGAFTLLPVPSLDGAVIARELRELLR
jgi:Zn-dependent protease